MSIIYSKYFMKYGNLQISLILFIPVLIKKKFSELNEQYTPNMTLILMIVGSSLLKYLCLHDKVLLHWLKF